MHSNNPTPPAPPEVSRRRFLQSAAAVAAVGPVSLLASSLAPTAVQAAGTGVEWRNKQPDMAYRRLGRTGLMISEVVSGGDPIKLDNYQHLDIALERGLNYLDMAPAYHRGDCELAYGKLLAGSSAKRQKVILTTKISGFTRQREQMYKEIFDGLPGEKREAILKKAAELRQQRGVDKPGYFLTYFPNQQRAFDQAYLRVAMMPDYRHKVEGDPSFRKFIVETLESSLKRVGTGHFDIVMCPHGANTPEDLECPEIVETFQQLKKQGKVRFLGVTSHNDPAGILRAATAAGHYDVVMHAYNVINGGYLEEAIRQAAAKGVGVIAMKVAMSVATHHKALQPIPQWRIDKVNQIVPGEMKAPIKAYLWALQNPNISAVISNLWDKTFIEENLSVAGKKVELHSA
jgi:aryl-alcohol dehydrogenase-like predicted oxidoreductase